jgi:putative heme-binding domain-containing protein
MSALRICVFTLVTSTFASVLWAQRPDPAVPAVVIPDGDAARGKALFEGKGNCLSCHRVNGVGSRMGPDLSDVGIARRGGGPSPPQDSVTAGNPAALEQKILDPDAEVARANRFVRVVTKDGTTLTGRLLNHDNFSVQFIEPSGKLRAFQKADLREFTLITKSQMPSYKGKLEAQEVADLVNYLMSLKGLTVQ